MAATENQPSAAIRIAAVSLIGDLGFAAAMPFALSHLARHGELPITPWGFRAFSGPFEQLGQERFTQLGWTLVGVCALHAVGESEHHSGDGAPRL